MSRANPEYEDLMPGEADRGRLEHERALIEQARASIASGHVVPDTELDPWLDRLAEGDEPLPIPGGSRPQTP